MGRLEALIVAALGRSPYDEDLVEPPKLPDEASRTGQQYDERGHPINLETRQRMRDHVRASNEVMLTAGIIEETVEVTARNKAIEASIAAEMADGRRRLEVGSVILVAGVWGACSLRRRILLYTNYSHIGVWEILKRERAVYSIPHMIGAGLPDMALFEGIELLRRYVHDLVIGDDRSQEYSTQEVHSLLLRISRHLVEFSFSWVFLHLRMFAALQQVNLIPSTTLFPSLRSLIPFSAHSPLQLPPLPSTLSPRAILSWVTQLGVNALPLVAVLVYSKLGSVVSYVFSALLYRVLPKPINLERFMAEVVSRQAMDVNGRQEDPISSSETLIEPFSEENISPPEAIPVSHAETLNALEGRSVTDIMRDLADDSSDDEEGEMTRTLISFDVEPTEVAESSMGQWSAELRNANETPQSQHTFYHTTALTLLPSLLAAEGFSWALSDIMLAPLEATMIRIVARAFRVSAGAGTADMYSILSPAIFLPWQGLLNMVIVDYAALTLTGSVWAVITLVSHAMGGRMMHLKGGKNRDLDRQQSN